MGDVTRRIHWSEPARFDQRRLRAWVERHRSDRARADGQRLKRAIEHLQTHPRMGRRVPVPDGGPEELRELSIAPYVIRYVLTEDAIIIVRIWHGRERPPERRT